jgi:probable HAF family extracellular repeat protein
MIGHPAPLTGEFEQVIMIAVVDRRDGWVGLSSCPRFALLLAVLISTAAGAQSCQPISGRYTLTDPGTLGGRVSYGGAINSAGAITGMSELSSLGNYDAFLWTPTGGMQDLGNLGGDSSGYAINSMENVAGSSYDNNGNLFAFLWTPATGIQNLGLLYHGFEAFSTATGLDDKNRVVGWQDDSQGTQALIFFAGKIFDLQKLSGEQFSSATGISSKGQVVGDGKADAVLWTKTKGLIHLGSLSQGTSRAWGISHSGAVVAGDNVGQNNTFTALAWILDPSTGSYVMNILGSGNAFAANDPCQVVGSMGPDGSTLAFVWTPTDGMKDLNTLIPPNSGLVLIEAFGINNSGQIVGTATDSHGNYHAYVLTPQP